MDLPLHDHGVDDGAEIVHGTEAVDTHHARGRIHLDLADIGAGREGEVGGVVESGLVQPRLQLVQRIVVRHIGRQRNLGERQLSVGAAYRELASREVDVGIAGLHQVGGNLLGLGLDLVQRLHDGRAAHADRARAIGAHAKGHAARIAMDDLHMLDGNAQSGRHHLGKSGLMPLTMTVRARKHRHAARGMDAHLAALEQTGTCA